MWKNKLCLSSLFAIFISVNAPSALALMIDNPVSAEDLPTLIGNISTEIITVVLPLAVIGIVYAGFRFITASASGNPGEIEKAKKMLLWIIVGAAIVVGASVLAKAVVNFAKGL